MGRIAATAKVAPRRANGETDATFGGFSRRGLDFFRELERHNERAWFVERKTIYQDQIEKPLHLLVAEVSRRCARAKLPLAPNPRQPSFRIYRDVRFSADKRPYKTHAGAALYRDGNKANPGSLYLHIDPKESFVAAGFYSPEKPVLQTLRQTMVGDGKAFLKMVALLGKRDLTLGSDDALKRLPRDYLEWRETDLEPYLKLRSLFTHRRVEQEVLLQSTLSEIIAAFAKDAAPLLRWGWERIPS